MTLTPTAKVHRRARERRGLGGRRRALLRDSDTGRRSNGSAVFELDEDHQLYRYAGLFKLGKDGDYSKQFYVATASTGDAAAALPSIDWRCASCSGAMKKAPGPLSVLAGCASSEAEDDRAYMVTL